MVEMERTLVREKNQSPRKENLLQLMETGSSTEVKKVEMGACGGVENVEYIHERKKRAELAGDTAGRPWPP